MEDHSLRSHVFQTIRDNILKGVYKDQEELREVTLGKELGVSRTPVREALRQLELEGLVTIVPNKGAYVRGITRKDVEDIYKIRSVCEGLCVRWAAEHITKEQIEQLEQIIMLSEYHLAKGNLEEMTEFDGQFHEVLYSASQSRIMDHILTDFHKYVLMARRNSVQSRERAMHSVEEHKAILEAIKDKNADLAQELVTKHIIQVMENLNIKYKEDNK